MDLLKAKGVVRIKMAGYRVFIFILFSFLFIFSIQIAVLRLRSQWAQTAAISEIILTWFVSDFLLPFCRTPFDVADVSRYTVYSVHTVHSAHTLKFNILANDRQTFIIHMKKRNTTKNSIGSETQYIHMPYVVWMVVSGGNQMHAQYSHKH